VAGCPAGAAQGREGASSFGSDFNFDFNVSVTEDQQRDGVEYNYQREAPVAETPSRPTSDGAAKGAAMPGTDVATYARERPGMSPDFWWHRHDEYANQGTVAR
jgi:predicted dithiol-disulfide oxidoreductase (DUF899 family)